MSYFVTSFSDINECDMITHNCHDDANCTNVVGSFNCACNSGYTGDGTTCQGMNSGYIGDGTTC